MHRLEVSISGNERLTMIMKVQSLAFAVYGLALFLVPEFLLDTMFGWESPELFWPRAAGVPLIGIALLEWHIARLDSRSGLVWPFVVTPGLYVVGFLWSFFADELAAADGYKAFFWVSFGISAFFLALMAWARATADG